MLVADIEYIEYTRKYVVNFITVHNSYIKQFFSLQNSIANKKLIKNWYLYFIKNPIVLIKNVLFKFLITICKSCYGKVRTYKKKKTKSKFNKGRSFIILF